MKKVIAFGVMLMPFIASAQLTSGVQDVSSAFKFASSFLSAATGLIFAAAFVVFIYGVFEFVRAAGDEEKRKEGRQFIVWGVIGLAVMASVYGLVGFLTKSANLQGNVIQAPTLPTIPA